ncbi:MAG: long-chain fatty acid--CoA ligase [Acidobacteriota bacterium]
MTTPDVDLDLDTRTAPDGSLRVRTIAELPFLSGGRFPKPDLIGQCRGDAVEYISGRDLVPRIRDISLGLSAIGMSRGDRVAILSESRPEWVFTDLAILTAGAISTPIYPTLSTEQIAFILRDSSASIVVVSSASQLDKLLVALPSAPAIKTIVVIDPIELPPASVPILALADVAERGHQRIRGGWGVAREYQNAAKAVRPEDLAVIIYTSGTTAEPKGVMLTHGNLAANLCGSLDVLDLYHDDVGLSFLPLCHALERIVAYVYLSTGISMIFAESIDAVPRNLLTVKPTVMSGVPRVFEKLYARIHERAAEASAPRRAMFRWAVKVARRRGEHLAAGTALPTSLRAASAIADRLVFSKIRAGIGGRLRYAVSGSAPLDPTLATFFLGVGLPILEGYGLTETAPVISVMPLKAIRFGTVGPPLRNVEVKSAEDGEFLVRGPNVMLGYYNRPADTAAVLRDGWFHTGDIGTIDAEGYLRLTDRKKEMLLTSGGKKIAPQPIEQRLRAADLVAEAILVGDRRHFPAALIVPDFRVLGARLGVSPDAARTRATASDVHQLFDAIVEDVNRDLAQFERIKKFVILDQELTMASGALTPTMKVKRRVVEEQFRAVIDEIYRSV